MAYGMLGIQLSLLMVSLVLADPPSSTLVAVKVQTASETLSGYAQYWDIDAMDLQQPLDEAAVKKLLIKHSPLVIFPENMISASAPVGYSYVYKGAATKLAVKKIKGIKVVSDDLAGHVPYTSPFIQADAHLWELLDGEPKYQCWLNDANAGEEEGAAVSKTWVSFNPAVGESELHSACSGTAPANSLPNKWGKHAKFRDVYWFTVSRGGG